MVDYNHDVVRDTMHIPNNINQWGEENYELTGYINDVNTEHTQVLMEYSKSGIVNNIYEYDIQRESMSWYGRKGYYAYDGRGSVADVTGSASQTMIQYKYNNYGETSSLVNGYNNYVRNPYRYNGERTDEVAGVPDQQYLRARYYNANMGRFLTSDTYLGRPHDPLSLSLYAYCGNNPVNAIDPSGMLPLVFHYKNESKGKDYYSFSPGTGYDNFNRALFDATIPFVGEDVYNGIYSLCGYEVITEESIADVINTAIETSGYTADYLVKHTEKLPKWLQKVAKKASKISGVVGGFLTGAEIFGAIFDQRQYIIDQQIDSIFRENMVGSTPEMVIKKYIYAYNEVVSLVDTGKISYEVDYFTSMVKNVNYHSSDVRYISEYLNEMEDYRVVCDISGDL